MQTRGHEGVLYAVPALDDYSSYTAMVFTQSKDQSAEKVVDLLTYLQRQAGYKVLCIRSDHGTEFQGALAMWCKRQGVHRQYSAVYTPEQNGRAERANRDEIEGARALLFQRNCPKKFWPHAMDTKSYVKNRVPAAGRTLSPLQMMFPNQVPDLSHLRVFGCHASLSIPKAKREGKFSPVSVTGTFVGYSPHTKGWRVAIGNQIHTSPSVCFREEMDGDSSVVPREDTTDSQSDDVSVVDVATGAHMHGAAPAPEVVPDAAPGDLPDQAPEACLLYTSPSPRD